MAIPSHYQLMLPVLQVLGESDILSASECAGPVADRLGLSQEEREERLPSGSAITLVNRIGWSAWYMMQAGLVARPRPGRFVITDEGRRLLGQKPAQIDGKTLAKYPSFVERVLKKTPADREDDEEATASESKTTEAVKTPNERIEAAFAELRRTLVSDLLDQLGRIDPFRFEQIVLDLLVAMGYGGSRAEAAQVTQKTGDEGIDGVINEDRLGLDVIYVQAKRWKNNVGRPEIQNFVGALAGKKASKGIFITTSDFHSNAREYATGLHQKVILVDGHRLAELMIEHNIGVSEEQVYRVKRVDSDYFSEDAL